MLVEELVALRQQNIQISEENIKLKADLEVQKDLAAELGQRLTNTQRAIARHQGEETESSLKLRKQIDQYITEIDNCIEWLQKA
jgi:hypothetical protein